MEIKFQKYYVTNGKIKARVHYYAYNSCVTLYAKSYQDGDKLAQIFTDGEYENNTDIQTDYFEEGRVRIKEGNPLYEAALARVKA